MSVLKVEGLVARARAFDFAALAALPGQVPDVSVLVPGREGTAVPLAALLAVVGVAADATHVTLESNDGRFAASTLLADVVSGVVVYALDGAPLPARLGGPCRFLLPAATACATGPADPCANVKDLGVLRLEPGMGRDTRPTTLRAHAELHAAEGEPQHPSLGGRVRS